MKNKLKNVLLLGAGQLGSRHLQALGAVSQKLNIYVVDPSDDSLKLSKQRFEEVKDSSKHEIKFLSSTLSLDIKEVDLGIIATSSNVRFDSFRVLLEKVKVHYAVLEKVLFSDPKHYSEILSLQRSNSTKVWVNCCMRQIKVYQQISTALKNAGRISYVVTASKFGLLTNAIHYCDHMSHILGNSNFKVDPSGLDLDLIQSKREGFKEATGTISVIFPDGSKGSFTNFSTGNSPIVVEIGSGTERFIIRELEGKGWHFGDSTAGRWSDIEAPITPQSILTTEIAEELFQSGTCPLTPLDESVQIHLNLYEPIREYFNLQQYAWT